MATLKISFHALQTFLDEQIDNDSEQGLCWSCGEASDYIEVDGEDYKCENCMAHNLQGLMKCIMELT